MNLYFHAMEARDPETIDIVTLGTEANDATSPYRHADESYFDSNLWTRPEESHFFAPRRISSNRVDIYLHADDEKLEAAKGIVRKSENNPHVSRIPSEERNFEAMKQARRDTKYIAEKMFALLNEGKN